MKLLNLKDVKFNKLIKAIFLLFFLLIFAINNYYYILVYTAPQDSDFHFFKSFTYYLDLFKGRNIPLTHYAHPPIPYLIVQPFYLLRGVSLDSACIGYIIFLLIFMLSMFGIGYTLGDYFSGITVMLLASSSPFTTRLSTTYFPDFPQTATTAMFIYFLIKTDHFKNRKYSLWAGLGLAISFLTKWSTAFFVIVPLLWEFSFLLPNLKKMWKDFLLFFLPLLVISVCIGWYYKNVSTPGDIFPTSNMINSEKWFIYYVLLVFLPILGWIFILHTTQRLKDTQNPFANLSLMTSVFLLTTLPWYMRVGGRIKEKFICEVHTYHPLSNIINSTVEFVLSSYSFFIIFFIIGLLVYLITKKGRIILGYLLLNILFILFLAVKIGFESPRYIYTLIIFLALWGGLWVYYTGKLKPYITSIIAIICLLSATGWMFTPWFFKHHLSVVYIRGAGRVNVRENPYLYFTIPITPYKKDYHISSLLAYLIKEKQENPNTTVLSIIKEDKEEFFISPTYLTEFTTPYGIYINPEFVWGIDTFKESAIRILRDRINAFLDRSECATRLVIIYHKGKVPTETFSKIYNIIAPYIKEIKVFDLGYGLKATVIKLVING